MQRASQYPAVPCVVASPPAVLVFSQRAKSARCRDLSTAHARLGAARTSLATLDPLLVVELEGSSRALTGSIRRRSLLATSRRGRGRFSVLRQISTRSRDLSSYAASSSRFVVSAEFPSALPPRTQARFYSGRRRLYLFASLLRPRRVIGHRSLPRIVARLPA